MKLEIFLDPQQESYAETKRTVITQRLTTALLLLLQELEAADLKHEAVIGKGISGDAAIGTFDKAAEAQRKHAELFPHNDDLVKQMERNRTLGGMVLPKEH